VAKETKVARTVFSGEGEERIMTRNFPALGKSLDVPVGRLYETYGMQGYEHGMKQRFGDFGALPAEWTEAEKQREELRRATAYLDHLNAGGDWKMNGERDTAAIVVEALTRIDSKKYPKEKLLRALELKPELAKEWRAAAKVKAMIAKIYAERAARAAKESDEELEIELEDDAEE
jgi:hypothetical protein